MRACKCACVRTYLDGLGRGVVAVVVRPVVHIPVPPGLDLRVFWGRCGSKLTRR